MEGIYECTAAAGDHSSTTLVQTSETPAIDVTMELTSPTHSLGVQQGKSYRVSFEAIV
jgi:hypothetical protein